MRYSTKKSPSMGSECHIHHTTIVSFMRKIESVLDKPVLSYGLEHEHKVQNEHKVQDELYLVNKFLGTIFHKIYHFKLTKNVSSNYQIEIMIHTSFNIDVQVYYRDAGMTDIIYNIPPEQLNKLGLLLSHILIMKTEDMRNKLGILTRM